MKRFPPQRLLVAADLSAPSLSALDAAKALARRWGSSLQVVHARPPAFNGWIGPEGLPMPLPIPAPAEERRLRARLREAAAGFPEDRLELRSVDGWPQEVLGGLAGGAEADLLVLGSHGYAGLDRLALGSVAEGVIRRARVPVLAVHPRAEPLRLSRVLAPWNGAPYATRALRYARELAASLDAELVVLRVFEPGKDRARDRASLRRLGSLLRGARWSLKTRAGDAREKIAREADSGRYGLLVLSAHRRPFSTDVVLGSTVERALRHSRIPVLAIPSGAAPRRLLPRPPAWVGGKIFSA